MSDDEPDWEAMRRQSRQSEVARAVDDALGALLDVNSAWNALEADEQEEMLTWLTDSGLPLAQHVLALAEECVLTLPPAEPEPELEPEPEPEPKSDPDPDPHCAICGEPFNGAWPRYPVQLHPRHRPRDAHGICAQAFRADPGVSIESQDEARRVVEKAIIRAAIEEREEGAA